jgi:23S rRNA pseudouridine1911/1915/1917 synthase
VREGGREALTHWRLVERYPGTDGQPVAALLACELETGRTHQVRVHLAHIGHPIMGDETYATGFKTKAARLSPAAHEALEALHRQALHAEHLAFEHPDTGELLNFRSPLPPDLARLRSALERPAS